LFQEGIKRGWRFGRRGKGVWDRIGSKYGTKDIGMREMIFSSRRLVLGVIGPMSNRAQVEGDENTILGGVKKTHRYQIDLRQF
jgi:hypothetical protein